MNSTVPRLIAVTAVMFTASTPMTLKFPLYADPLPTATSLSLPHTIDAGSDEHDAMKVAASADETHPLGLGAKIPDHMQLIDIDGKPFNLNAAVAAKPTILIFYRGSWCPFCNLQMAQLEEIEPKLEAQGYQILAISPDLPSNLQVSVGKHHLTYTLLSDSNMGTSEAFGLAYHVDDDTYAHMSSFGVNLEAATGTKQRELPVPAAYVLDRFGTIRFAYSNPNFRVRVDPQKLLTAATAALSVAKSPN